MVVALPQCRVLNSIELCSSNISDKGCVALAVALSQCPFITNINLRGNSIGDYECKALAKALIHCLSITSLDLGNNRIGDNGFNALAAALPQCRTITNTLLIGNGLSVIKNKSMSAIKSVLERNTMYNLRWSNRHPLLLLSLSCLKLLQLADDASSNTRCEGDSSSELSSCRVDINDTSRSSFKLSCMILLVKYIV